MPRRVANGLLGLLVVLVLLAPLPKLFAAPSASMEEGSLLTYPTLALAGEVPTKDFWTEYGPLNVWVPAAAYAVAGSSVPVERVVGLAYRIVLLLALYGLLRRWSRRGALAAVLVSWLLLAPFGLIAYSWIGGLAALLGALALGLEALERGARAGPFALAAGLSAGVALSFRPDLVLAVAALGLVLLWRAPRRRVLEAAGGAGLGLLPLLALVLLAGPGNVMANLFIDPVLNLRAGRHLPFPPPMAGGGEYFTSLTVLQSRRWQGPGINAQIVAGFWLLVAVGLLFAVAAVVLYRRGGPRRRADLAVLVTALALAPQVVQRLDLNHLRFVACIWLPLAAWAASRLLDPEGRAVRAWPVGVVGLAALIAAPTAVGTSFTNTLPLVGRPVPASSQVVAGGEGRSITMDTQGQARDLRRLLGVLRSTTPRGARFIEGPSDLRFANYSETSMYWQLPELEPATYYLEFNPGITNTRSSRLSDELGRADVVVLSRRFAAFNEPNDSVVPGFNGPNEVLARRFCVAARIGPYELLVTKATGGGVDPTRRPVAAGPERVAWCANPPRA